MVLATTATKGFTADLAALVSTTGLGPVFTKYLEECEVRDVLDVASLASSEERFEKVLEDAEIGDKPREAIKARKLWFLAKEAKSSRETCASNPAAAAVSDESPLAPGVVESLRDNFAKTHNFHFAGSRLLADAAFNSTYRGLHKEPKKLKVVLLENVRSMASIDTDGELSGLLMSKTGSVSEVKQAISPVNTAHELWMRIRIVMCSICYIMLGHEGFLSLETVENLMEELNDMIFHRLEGGRPDVRFFNRAYLLTMHHWSNQLRLTDCSMESLVLAKTGWIHYWTNYAPSAGASAGSSGAAGAHDLSSLPKDLMERVAHMQTVTKALQSRMDKQAFPARDNKRAYPSAAGGADKDNNKNKDGKNKGAGKGGNKKKPNNYRKGRGNKGRNAQGDGQ